MRNSGMCSLCQITGLNMAETKKNQELIVEPTGLVLSLNWVKPLDNSPNCLGAF